MENKFCMDTNTTFFKACEAKMEKYLESGDPLLVDNWSDLWVAKEGKGIVFYNECDLVLVCDNYQHYEENLKDAVIWVLKGAKDPLHRYN